MGSFRRRCRVACFLIRWEYVLVSVCSLSLFRSGVEVSTCTTCLFLASVLIWQAAKKRKETASDGRKMTPGLGLCGVG